MNCPDVMPIYGEANESLHFSAETEHICPHSSHIIGCDRQVSRQYTSLVCGLVDVNVACSGSKLLAQINGRIAAEKEVFHAASSVLLASLAFKVVWSANLPKATADHALKCRDNTGHFELMGRYLGR